MTEEFEQTLRQAVHQHAMFLDPEDVRDGKAVLEEIAQRMESADA